MNIAVLTGGGDCPGLNAAIRAVCRQAITVHKYNVIGIKNGWEGLINGNLVPLALPSVSGILSKGGTILGTSRKNPFKNEDDIQRIKDNIKRFDLHGLIIIGGIDILRSALNFHEMGVPLVGIPETVDNNVGGTDFNFGFDTAVNIATEAIDRLHSTAESHNRVMIIEVMGRYTGWIAVTAGMASGADYILIPEIPLKIEQLIEVIENRRKRGRNFSIIVAAEGAEVSELGGIVKQTDKVDDFGNPAFGGIGEALGREIERLTGIETRTIKLGHIQRGGTPTPYDRILATRMGISAVNLVSESKFGYMTALRGMEIVAVPIIEAVAEQKPVQMDLYEAAKLFFG